MNGRPDSWYFKQRAEQEALAAAQARCKQAREAHGTIARRYLELAQELEVYDREPAARSNGRTGLPGRNQPKQTYVWYAAPKA